MLSKDRIFGLDLLRATAVLLVIFHHSLFYLTAPGWVRSFGWVGEVGVTGLLLLSGYLIGQGLIKKSRDGRFS
jgi:peptidoglycan/LPS O-acetylase OafA/YrhL